MLGVAVGVVHDQQVDLGILEGRRGQHFGARAKISRVEDAAG